MPPRFSGLSSTSDLSFISSEPSVITSQSGKRFFVHSDIIGDLHLYTLDQSPRDIDLSAWNDDTVSRWIQFLYAGNYQIPEPVWQEDDKEAEEEEGEVEEGDEQAPTDRDGSNTPDTVQSQLQAYQETCENVLLPYADIYVLAHSVGPDELEKTAFDRLSSALHSAGSFLEKGASKPAIDFIEVLAYTLKLPEISNLRIILGRARGLALFMDFAVTHFGNLMAREEMTSLMRKHGDFAIRLMGLVANKVRETESDARNWKDQAFALGEALQESIYNHEKFQASVVTKHVDMWILKKERGTLMSEHPEIKLNIDDNIDLYRHDPWTRLRTLRMNLGKLYTTHTELRQEFKVYISKDMEEFVSFDTRIVEYLDSCLEATSKLFRSDWSGIVSSENYLRNEYEASEAGRASVSESFARVGLTALTETDTEGRPETPLRPLELDIVKSVHKLRWLEGRGFTTLVGAATRNALLRCLVVRAAWLDDHAEWTKNKIKWYKERLLQLGSSSV
ncbi:hypothetical protein DFP73DRAFT_559047 [Morchella snyderi]|nr:hypothetical protein DFP73DRAFT_559047 [Morchella snyderi]